MNTKKAIVGIGAIMLAAGVGYAIDYARDMGAIAAGYVSHTLCTNVLIIGRDQGNVETQDLSYDQRTLTHSIITDNKVETTAQLGPISYTTTSVHRPGLGCSNIAGRRVEAVENIALTPLKSALKKPTLTPQNVVVTDSPGVDYTKLQAAVNKAFDESSADIYQQKNTRAVLVHHKGQLIAQQYAEGFTATTPLRGMSMTKSVTSALIGILVRQGKLDIEKPAPIKGWSELNGNRKLVTTHHLLKMIAGFDYNEAYETDPRNLLSTMLMTQADMPAFAAKTRLVAEPGNSWDYQTVHSVLLSEVIRNTIANDQVYFRFAKQELFAKLGMHNSFLQADANGSFVGGAFMYASAPDWLQFGLFYLNDGVHNGQRILPEGWVNYSTTASGASLKKRGYGAQFWLNTVTPHQLFPDLPEDTYAAQGHYGQYVVIIPSMDLVIVRLGMTFDKNAFDREAFLNEVVGAITPNTQVVRATHNPK